MKDKYFEIDVNVNPAQFRLLTLMAKYTYCVWSRGTGKSWIVAAFIDEIIRTMPRCVITLAQATYGQALTKTLPSTFKALEAFGYVRYNEKTKQGDYVVCRTPPDGYLRPYEHIMDFSHCITFSNGTLLYILSQDGNSRGPNADFNITDEAITINKQKFDEEVAPTNRGNEQLFGSLSKHPKPRHHGGLFVTSAPYEAEQKWILEHARYYEEERGYNLIDRWNSVVKLQMQLIDAKSKNDAALFKDIWNECVRIRRTIQPFVSKDGELFHLASIFDNIANVGFSYIMREYAIMDKLTFMVEILNFISDKIEGCYYHFNERNKYYNATNDVYIREFSEDIDFNFDALADGNSLYDADCNANKPLELCFDWGSRASFLEVAQPSTYDFATYTTFIGRVVDNTINEFYAKRDENDDTEVNVIIDQFCNYYRHHVNKTAVFFRDRYGDIRHANSKKTYNEMAIERLIKNGWQVEQRTHPGIEPPQHEKYLLWSYVTAEKDERFPIKRFNATKCKHILLSMNNTKVKEVQGKFQKDKSSERNSSIDPLDATHFGDVVDKRMWTKYGHLIKKKYDFVPVRV